MTKLNLDEKLVIESYDRTKNIKETAKEIGCSTGPIIRILKENSIVMEKTNYKTEEKRKLRSIRMKDNKLGATPRSEESKKKYSLSKQGDKNSQFGKKGKLSPNFGKKRLPFSKEWKKNMSKSHTGKRYSERSGEKAWNWKGGITPLNVKIRNCFKYKAWRTFVFQRDFYTCQECDKTHCYLEAHHIKSVSDIINENNIKTITEALFCDILWNTDNGITLCQDCHKKTDNYKNKKKIK